MATVKHSNLPDDLKQLLATPELADLGPRTRAGTLLEEALNVRIDSLFGRNSAPKRIQDLVRGTVLLWHDHLDAAHVIAQAIEDADGSLLHGIMHRRESDYGNAKYWFRRAGRHACFPILAQQTKALLGSAHAALAARLAPGGSWDAFAFIDACEDLARQRDIGASPRVLQEIQEIEFQVFLESLCLRLG